MSVKIRKGSPNLWYDFRLDGRRYRGSTRSSNPAKAAASEKKLIKSLQPSESSVVARQGRSLTELLEAFLSFVENARSLAPRSKASYVQGVRILRNCSLRDQKVEKITSSMIATTKIGTTPATTNMALRTLRRALWLAADMGVITRRPRVHLLKEKIRTRLFKPSEEEAILQHAKQPLKDVFILMMNTGMRPKELLTLKWCDIDLARKALRVRSGKTAASNRFLGLTSEAEAVLLRRHAERNSQSPWLFPKINHIGPKFLERSPEFWIPVQIILRRPHPRQ